jgi:hypothetical protein
MVAPGCASITSTCSPWRTCAAPTRRAGTRGRRRCSNHLHTRTRRRWTRGLSQHHCTRTRSSTSAGARHAAACSSAGFRQCERLARLWSSLNDEYFLQNTVDAIVWHTVLLWPPDGLDRRHPRGCAANATSVAPRYSSTGPTATTCSPTPRRCSISWAQRPQRAHPVDSAGAQHQQLPGPRVGRRAHRGQGPAAGHTPVRRGRPQQVPRCRRGRRGCRAS